MKTRAISFLRYNHEWLEVNNLPPKILTWILMLIIIAPVYSMQVNNNYQDSVIDSPYKVYDEDLSLEIYNSVSEDSYRNFIIKLTENGSRWTEEGEEIVFSEANALARFWISNQLRELSNGRISVEILGNHRSIVGILPGWIPYDAPCIIIGGHYDSVPGAPGANDDGTGIATILELARVMANYSWPLDVYFCAWNSEEIGLLGSAEIASNFRKKALDILVYYNIDMLLVEDIKAPIDERILMAYNSNPMISYQTSHLFADITRMMSNNLGLNLIKPEPSSKFPYWPLSDHASFLREGYGNVLFAFESGIHLDSSYHRPSDVWDNPLYNYTLARETVACIGASIAFIMARAYGKLTHMEYSGSLDSYGSRKYYFPISTSTNIIIDSHSESSKLRFILYSPNGTLLDDEIQSNLNYSTEELGLFLLVIENNDSVTIPFDVEIEYESDFDGNNVSDSLQSWFEPEMFERDLDGDGLVDGHEVLIGTTMWVADTDSDEIPDGWEVENGLDPLTDDANLDFDDDNLSNLQEYQIGTNPFNNDTDNDSIPDDWEAENGLNPLVNDADEDPDLDGLSNLEEYLANLDPQHSDSFPVVLFITGTVSFSFAVVVGYALIRRRNMTSNT